MRAPGVHLREEELALLTDYARVRVAGAKGSRAHEEYQGRLLDWIIDKLRVEPRTLYWSTNEGYAGRAVGWDRSQDPYKGAQQRTQAGEFDMVAEAWDGDVDPFVAATRAVDRWENVGIESGTGTGKTFYLACLTLAFLACYRDSIVITAAPKEDQLLSKVWKEIERLFPRFQVHFPQARFMAGGEVRMLDGASRTWRAFAQVTGVGAGEESATKAQGDHAEYMLIITEETPGMKGPVMTAYENTRTGPYNIQVSVGNPDSEEDELHKFCLQDDVVHIRVSAFDHPNVVTGDDAIVPGAVSRAAIERRARKYEPMPVMYETRVRGISPEQAAGVALNFRSAQHLRSWPIEALRFVLEEKGWPLYLGIDYGAWRFAVVWATTNPAGELHVVREYFSQDQSLEVRAGALVAQWESLGAPSKVRGWGDPAGRGDLRELKKELARISKRRTRDGKSRVRWQLTTPPDVDEENKKLGRRRTAVTRLNLLLGRRALYFAKELETEGGEWRKGQHTGSEGEPMHGSRLLWEIRKWRYPDPREGQAQPQDPDDDSADGADAVAALRYLVMGWWKAAPPPKVEPKPDRNRDTGLEQLVASSKGRRRALEAIRTARGGRLR